MILIQSTDFLGREALSIIQYCNRENKRYKLSKVPDTKNEYDFIVGSVAFVEKCIGKNIKPDYFPEWLDIKRDVSFSLRKPSSKCFVKPASRYKLFEGFSSFYGFEGCIPSDPEGYWCSEIITPTNEWRVYVSQGKVLCSFRYDDFVSTVKYVPRVKQFEKYLNRISKNIPKNWCGTIDIMDTVEYGMDICECHHPYAIGWYGDTQSIGLYYDFLKNGYNYIKNPYNFR